MMLWQLFLVWSFRISILTRNSQSNSTTAKSQKKYSNQLSRHKILIYKKQTRRNFCCLWMKFWIWFQQKFTRQYFNLSLIQIQSHNQLTKVLLLSKSPIRKLLSNIYLTVICLLFVIFRILKDLKSKKSS